jgi:hypothetical protein
MRNRQAKKCDDCRLFKDGAKWATSRQNASHYPYTSLYLLLVVWTALMMFFNLSSLAIQKHVHKEDGEDSPSDEFTCQRDSN